MLELAISIADRLISLVREGHKQDRQLHDDFFVPFLAEVDRLHQNYMDTFATYRETLRA